MLQHGADSDFPDRISGDIGAGDGGFEGLCQEFFGVGFCEVAFYGAGEGYAES